MSSQSVHEKLAELSRVHGVVITMPWSQTNKVNGQPSPYLAVVLIQVLGVGRFQADGKGTDPENARLDAIDSALAKCPEIHG